MRACSGVSMLVVLPIDDVTHPVTAVLLPAVAWMTVRLVTPCTISLVNRSFWLTPNDSHARYLVTKSAPEPRPLSGVGPTLPSGMYAHLLLVGEVLPLGDGGDAATRRHRDRSLGSACRAGHPGLEDRIYLNTYVPTFKTPSRGLLCRGRRHSLGAVRHGRCREQAGADATARHGNGGSPSPTGESVVTTSTSGTSTSVGVYQGVRLLPLPCRVPEVGLGLRPEVIDIRLRWNMIVGVSLRPLYLIFVRLLGWQSLLRRNSGPRMSNCLSSVTMSLYFGEPSQEVRLPEPARSPTHRRRYRYADPTHGKGEQDLGLPENPVGTTQNHDKLKPQRNRPMSSSVTAAPGFAHGRSTSQSAVSPN
jgi:hypothetical protein